VETEVSLLQASIIRYQESSLQASAIRYSGKLSLLIPDI